MTYRGRLIFPFAARIARLDTAATEAANGYDHEFRTVKHSYPSGVRGARVTARVELPIVTIPCQVEVQQFNEQAMARTGDMAKVNLTLVMHFEDLEKAGLAVNGSVSLHTNDRLVAIVNKKTGAVAQAMPDNVFAVEVQPGGFGLGLARNLVIARFEDREQGRSAASG